MFVTSFMAQQTVWTSKITKTALKGDDPTMSLLSITVGPMNVLSSERACIGRVSHARFDPPISEPSIGNSSILLLSKLTARD